MTRLKWSDAAKPIQNRPNRHPSERAGCSIERTTLEKIAEERRLIALWLLREAGRRQASDGNHAILLLLAGSVLLAGLGVMSGISKVQPAPASSSLHWLFGISAVVAGLILALSMVLVLVGLFFRRGAGQGASAPRKESLFFNPESGAAPFPDGDAFQAGFHSATRERLLTSALLELYEMGQAQNRVHEFFRWAAILFLVALFPYLLALVALIG